MNPPLLYILQARLQSVHDTNSLLSTQEQMRSLTDALRSSNYDVDPMLHSSRISINAQLILAVAASSVSCDRELYLCNKLTPSTTEKDESLVTVQIISVNLNLEQKEQIQSFFFN